MAHNPDIIKGWFDLFMRLKTEFNVQDEDIYNMDKKGFMMGVIAKMRVMVSKYEFGGKYMTQCGNRDWVSLIECVSLDGRVLKPWIIFKAKVKQKAWFEALGDKGSIATSENGWTDNELGLEWLQKCFDLESSATQKGEYRMLCVDGHASHITTTAIEYAIQNKIILLCLPSHSTHVLQPLDVGIFAPLTTHYKNNIFKISRLGGSYQIDKVDFIEQYLLARDAAFTAKIIQSAWQKTGLLLFDPEVVLRQLFPDLKGSEQVSEPIREQISLQIHPSYLETPLKGVLSYSGSNGIKEVALTPANALQVQGILRNLQTGVDLTSAIHKVGNACIHAMTSLSIERTTNQDLLELNKRKDNKKKRAKGNYGGEARVMNQEIISDRNNRTKILTPKQQEALEKKKAAAFKREILSIGVDVFTFETPQQKTPRKTPKKTPKKTVHFVPPFITPPASFSPLPPPSPSPSPMARKARSRTRLVVKLSVRVTTEELSKGRWRPAMSKEGEVLGRGQRTRRAPKKPS